MQDVIKTACLPDPSGTGLPPRLREAIILMLSAAPQGSELVRDVVVAIQHGLEVACSVSLLPELVLRLLQVPAVSQVSLLPIHSQDRYSFHQRCCTSALRLADHHAMDLIVAGHHLFACIPNPIALLPLGSTWPVQFPAELCFLRPAAPCTSYTPPPPQAM